MFVNPNRPSGLQPIKYTSGAAWTGGGNMYYIAATDTNPYYQGDLVKLAAGGDPTTGLPGITLGTAGATAVGVIAAVGIGSSQVGTSGQGGGAGGGYFNPNNLTQTYRPSGAQPVPYYALVIDDPDVIFEIQEGGTATNLTSAVLGEYANILYAAPATGVYLSGTTLNGASVAAAPGTLNLKIVSLAQRADNHFVTSPASGGGGQKWWVRIVNHSYNGIAPTGI